MASKSGLSKILEFIGLVDDVPEDNGYADSGRYAASSYQTNAYNPRAGRGGASSGARRGAGAQSSARGAARAQTGAAGYDDRSGAYRAARPEASRAVATRRPETNLSAGKASTVIYYLHSLEECCDVISDLIENKTVLLNLEEMDATLMQRAVDTLSGAAFALNATLRKASEKTYLIAPVSVEVNFTRNVERKY